MGFWLVALAGWVRVVAFLVLGSGRARTVAKLIAVVRGTVVVGVGFLGTLTGAAWGKGTLEVAEANLGWFGPAGRAFRVKVVLELE